MINHIFLKPSWIMNCLKYNLSDNASCQELKKLKNSRETYSVSLLVCKGHKVISKVLGLQSTIERVIIHKWRKRETETFPGLAGLKEMSLCINDLFRRSQKNSQQHYSHRVSWVWIVFPLHHWNTAFVFTHVCLILKFV